MSDIFILPKHPKHYPQQRDYKSCGLFSIKAIIETKHSDMNHVSWYYASSRFHEKIRISLWSHLMKSLRKHTIKANFWICTQESTEQAINFLKNKIKEWPVLITIAHSYDKKTQFSLRRTVFFWHHMTVWGYDDTKRVFYCYDSHTDVKMEWLPVGNIALDYDKLMIYRKLCGLGLFWGRYIATK